MKAYIAGPMRGYPGHNFDAFDEAAERLTVLGFDVINPAAMDRAAGYDGVGDFPDGFVREAMRRDLSAICDCDAIVLIAGWEKSKGVAVELALAKYLGLEVITEHGGYH